MTGDACAPDLGKHSLRHAYLRSSTFSSSHSMPDIASDLLRCLLLICCAAPVAVPRFLGRQLN